MYLSRYLGLGKKLVKPIMNCFLFSSNSSTLVILALYMEEVVGSLECQSTPFTPMRVPKIQDALFLKVI